MFKQRRIYFLCLKKNNSLPKQENIFIYLEKRKKKENSHMRRKFYRFATYNEVKIALKKLTKIRILLPVNKTSQKISCEKL